MILHVGDGRKGISFGPRQFKELNAAFAKRNVFFLGMSNFAEYAFGLNPTTGASLNSVRSLVGENFSYTRTSDTCLIYKVWHLMNLQDWFTTLETQGAATSLGGVVESVSVTLDGSLLAEP